MKKIPAVVAVLAALVVSLSACGGGSSSGSADSPQDAWIQAVKASGWVAKGGDYGTMFQRANLLCDMSRQDAETTLSLGLSDSESAKHMKEIGVSQSEAVDAYMDATEAHVC